MSHLPDAIGLFDSDSRHTVNANPLFDDALNNRTDTCDQLTNKSTYSGPQDYCIDLDEHRCLLFAQRPLIKSMAAPQTPTFKARHPHLFRFFPTFSPM